MSELRTPHLTDNAIFSADMWNAAFRASAAGLAELFMHLLHGGQLPSGTGGVIGGLEISDVPGDPLKMVVSPGWAFLYDDTVAAPASKFRLLCLTEPAEITLEPSASPSYHWHTLSLTCDSVPDTAEWVPFWHAAAQNISTQRGPHATIDVLRGPTTTVPQFIPAAGAVLLYGLKTTAAGIVEIKDFRRRLSLTRRTQDAPTIWRSTPEPVTVPGLDQDDFQLAEIYPAALAATPSRLGWSRDEDWPSFKRAIISGATEETAQTLYPLVVPGGRTWSKTVSWLNGGASDPFSGTLGITAKMSASLPGLLCDCVSSGPPNNGEGFFVAIPVEHRGLRFEAASFCMFSHGGVSLTPSGDNSISLWLVNAAGSTKIANLALPLNVYYPRANLDVPALSHPVLQEGDALVAVWKISFASPVTYTNFAAAISFTVTFCEGRTD